MCTSAPKVRVGEHISQPHIFCISSPELLEVLPYFFVKRKINPLNAKHVQLRVSINMYTSIY